MGGVVVLCVSVWVLDLVVCVYVMYVFFNFFVLFGVCWLLCGLLYGFCVFWYICIPLLLFGRCRFYLLGYYPFLLCFIGLVYIYIHIYY